MEIDIYGYKYNLTITDDNPSFVKNDNECGYTNYMTMEICVRKSMNKQTIFQTIIHELTHAYLNCQGRLPQENFPLEEVCEFVGFCAPKIVDTAKMVMEAFENGEKSV
jgi:hypothetical protein